MKVRLPLQHLLTIVVILCNIPSAVSLKCSKEFNINASPSSFWDEHAPNRVENETFDVNQTDCENLEAQFCLTAYFPQFAKNTTIIRRQCDKGHIDLPKSFNISSALNHSCQQIANASFTFGSQSNNFSFWVNRSISVNTDNVTKTIDLFIFCCPSDNCNSIHKQKFDALKPSANIPEHLTKFEVIESSSSDFDHDEISGSGFKQNMKKLDVENSEHTTLFHIDKENFKTTEFSPIIREITAAIQTTSNTISKPPKAKESIDKQKQQSFADLLTASSGFNENTTGSRASATKSSVFFKQLFFKTTTHLYDYALNRDDYAESGSSSDSGGGEIVSPNEKSFVTKSSNEITALAKQESSFIATESPQSDQTHQTFSNAMQFYFNHLESSNGTDVPLTSTSLTEAVNFSTEHFEQNDSAASTSPYDFSFESTDKSTVQSDVTTTKEQSPFTTFKTSSTNLNFHEEATSAFNLLENNLTPTTPLQELDLSGSGFEKETSGQDTPTIIGEFDHSENNGISTALFPESDAVSRTTTPRLEPVTILYHGTTNQIFTQFQDTTALFSSGSGMNELTSGSGVGNDKSVITEVATKTHISKQMQETFPTNLFEQTKLLSIDSTADSSSQSSSSEFGKFESEETFAFTSKAPASTALNNKDLSAGTSNKTPSKSTTANLFLSLSKTFENVDKTQIPDLSFSGESGDDEMMNEHRQTTEMFYFSTLSDSPSSFGKTTTILDATTRNIPTVFVPLTDSITTGDAGTKNKISKTTNQPVTTNEITISTNQQNNTNEIIMSTNQQDTISEITMSTNQEDIRNEISKTTNADTGSGFTTTFGELFDFSASGESPTNSYFETSGYQSTTKLDSTTLSWQTSRVATTVSEKTLGISSSLLSVITRPTNSTSSSTESINNNTSGMFTFSGISSKQATFRPTASYNFTTNLVSMSSQDTTNNTMVSRTPPLVFNSYTEPNFDTNQQLSVLLFIRINTDISNQTFIDNLEENLALAYTFAFQVNQPKTSDETTADIQMHRRARSLLETENSFEVKVAQAIRRSLYSVEVKFGVYWNGEPVEPLVAEETLRRLPPREISNVLGYPVLSPITAVSIKELNNNQGGSKAFVASVSVLSILIIILIFSFLGWSHFHKQTKVYAGPKKDNNLSEGSLPASVCDSTEAFFGSQALADKEYPTQLVFERNVVSKEVQTQEVCQKQEVKRLMTDVLNKEVQTYEVRKEKRLATLKFSKKLQTDFEPSLSSHAKRSKTVNTQTDVWIETGTQKNEISIQMTSPTEAPCVNLISPDLLKEDDSDIANEDVDNRIDLPLPEPATSHKQSSLSFLPALPEQGLPLILQPIMHEENEKFAINHLTIDKTDEEQNSMKPSSQSQPAILTPEPHPTSNDVILAVQRTLKKERQRNKKRIKKLKKRIDSYKTGQTIPIYFNYSTTSLPSYQSCTSPQTTIRSIHQSDSQPASSQILDSFPQSVTYSNNRTKMKKKSKVASVNNDLEESLKIAKNQLESLVDDKEDEMLSPAYQKYQIGQMMRWKQKTYPVTDDAAKPVAVEPPVRPISFAWGVDSLPKHQ